MQDYQLQLVPAMLRELRHGPDDRVLPSHSVSSGRALHAASVAQGDRQGNAGRRSDRLPLAWWRKQFPVFGPKTTRTQDNDRGRRCSKCARACGFRLSRRQGGGISHLRRFGRAGAPVEERIGPAPRTRIEGRARKSRKNPAGSRPPGLHQGHRPATASPQGTPRRGPLGSGEVHDGAARHAQSRTRANTISTFAVSSRNRWAASTATTVRSAAP